MKLVQIVAIPPGEAPEKVRAAWIGATIPLADIEAPQPGLWSSRGVLGKELGFLAQLKRLVGIPVIEQPSVGYVVEVLAAMEVLKSHAPAAATWWEQHTPHLIKPGKKFLFDASCCKEVPGGAP
ncbi:MAG: hypothetical protein J0I77_11285 [Rudaea sp.]|uniref:hypothetical protein n=1 Tax=unclassified Rudaea TaxID=2627037 RepID=UPI0010F58AFB|nr:MULTISPECIES: hypothetical protein [unclassified Rudaea]MBN8886294.1 hypothetical protein [Rudaea sp.]MBR0344337.1 hypothetical protein [Rudaea sp.]